MGHMWSALSPRQKYATALVGITMGFLGPKISDEFAFQAAKDPVKKYELLPETKKVKMKRPPEVVRSQPNNSEEQVTQDIKKLTWKEKAERRKRFMEMAKNQQSSDSR